MEQNQQKQDKKVVTIFGSSKVDTNSQIFKDSQQLGYEFCKRGFTIRTGGQDEGDGLMSAASIGAEQANKELGLNLDIEGIILANCWGGKPIKQCTHSIFTENIGNRTEELCKDAKVFVVLPGGKGTLLELVYLINSRGLPSHDDKGNSLFNYTKSRIYVLGKEWKQVFEQLVVILAKNNVTESIMNEFIFYDNALEIISHLDQNPIE